MQRGLAYEALRESRVDLVDVYSSDGKLYGANLRDLQDDRHFFPRTWKPPWCEKRPWPAFLDCVSILESLRDRLDDREMQRLNHEVETRRGNLGAVALEFLRGPRIDAAHGGPESERSRGFWWFLWGTAEHEPPVRRLSRRAARYIPAPPLPTRKDLLHPPSPSTGQGAVSSATLQTTRENHPCPPPDRGWQTEAPPEPLFPKGVEVRGACSRRTLLRSGPGATKILPVLDCPPGLGEESPSARSRK